MPVIKISAFAGEKPLITPRLLPETAAVQAFNLRLNDGALTPTNKSTVTGGVAGNVNHKTIYRFGTDWLSWSGIISAAPGPVASDRLYYMGDGAPKMRVGSTVYPLKLDRPAAALTAALSGTGNGDTQSRTYVYTWVTDFGEESAPSPAAAIVNWKPGNTVTLSGFVAAPGGRNITKQRIYRTQTGASGTYLYFIAERTASASNYVDTIPVTDFQEALPSADWNTPPDSLNGLVAMPNGMMAAFSGKDVYFCEAWRPHAWPEKYIMTCDNTVVGLRAIGSSLVVMTTGQPYFMSGATPDSMQSQKLEANFPCINARGIVDLGFAICYPSNLGLVTVRGDGSIALASVQLFDRDLWLSFSPSTIVAAQHNGNYVMFYDATDPDGERRIGALMINVDAAQFLVRSDERADAVYFSESGEALYFKRPGETAIMRFDSPTGTPETYYWRSKEYWTSQPVNFGAILVDLDSGISVASQARINEERAAIAAQNDIIFATDLMGAINAAPINVFAINDDALLPYPDYLSIVVSVFADGELVHAGTKADRVIRLPAKKKARRWEIDVSANVPITQILMAGTIDELRGSQ